MAKRTWAIDPTHSEVQFKIRHLMITNVTGSFDIFQASVETEDEDFSKAKVSFTTDVDSINTGNEQRDGHLKAPDFFDAAAFPQIKFVATKTESVDNDGSYDLYGDLTIRDVTKDVKFAVVYGGTAKDQQGNTKAGFGATTTINRLDYNIKYDPTGAGVAKDVTINLNLEFVQAK